VRLPVISVAIGLSASCASHPVTRTKQPHFEQRPPVTSREPTTLTGVVVDADGRPAADAVVTIADPVKGQQLAILRADSAGAFRTALQPAVYAMTATDDGQSAFVPSIDGQRAPVTIQLSRECANFEGHLETDGEISSDSFVELVRFSDSIGDSFATLLAADGGWRACLPAATYKIEPPASFARRLATARVPSDALYRYRTATTVEANRVLTQLAGISPETSAAFVAALPSTVRALGLGESNHGAREFYEERTALALSLAKRGTRLLMIEAGNVEMLPVDEYLSGKDVDIARAVQELGYWIWDTKTFLHSLEKIRAYNRKLPRDQRIHILGFDVQGTQAAVTYLKSHAAKRLKNGDLALLDKVAIDKGKPWTTLADDERARIHTLLSEIAAAPVTADVTSIATRNVLAADQLIARFEMLEGVGEPQRAMRRDKAMAHMVLEVLRAAPNARAMLWAHLDHVAREYIVGEPTMGYYLNEALGGAYSAYALLAATGSARAWDLKHETGVMPRPLDEPPPHSVEAVLRGAANGAAVTYWTFSRASGEAARWLAGVHALRSFGAVFMDERNWAYWNLQAMDGVVLFDSVSPADPTPTGERRATPKQN
jgi:erythromycin esterase-like protein